MKTLILMIAGIFLLSGCGSFQEAYQLDQEFGLASQDAWDKQIVHTDYRYAENTPEEIDGITAEEIMGVYNETFAKEPENVEIFQFGVEESR